MTFQPIVLGNGVPAWLLLKRTLQDQQQLYASNYLDRSDTEFFSEKFPNINSSDDIVSDRRIMRVVLGAYGLSEDINNRYFIKEILDEGVHNQGALANRLSDRRYRNLASDFDFSISPPSHKLATNLRQKVIDSFRSQSFEEAVGEIDGEMRLALTFQRTLNKTFEQSSSNSANWFRVMATPPLREVLQTSLGFPKEFTNLDIDDQLERFLNRSEHVFGTNTLSEFLQENRSEEVVRRYLIIKQASQFRGVSSAETALTLLRNISS